MDNKKKIGIAIILVILLIAIAGGSYLINNETIAGNSESKIITDMSGKKVAVPSEVKSVIITCCGGVSNEFAVLGAHDRVIAQPEKCLSDNLLAIIPQYGRTADTGSFNDVNTEEIVRLNPDIVIASVTSGDGNAMIENTGIPVITVLTGKATLEKLPFEFEMMGEILGKEKEASALISYWNEKISMVNERVEKISTDEKKTVYYMLGNTLHTNGGNWWGQDFITAAGGINVAENETLRDINLEELCLWNPDVIIISSNEGSYIPVEDVKNNPQLGIIKAVQNDELYECPIGTFWWDRPSPETPLGIMWLAKTLYPEKFEDISIEDETNSFYKNFYGYDLNDDELIHIINPKSASFMDIRRVL